MAVVGGMIAVAAAETSRYSEFWDSFVHLDCPPGTVVQVARGANVADNRNLLTRWMLATTAEWIWYVDDDQIFSPDTLIRLLAHQVDVVSGVYLSRDFPFKPLVFDTEDAQGRCGHRLFSQGDVGLVPALAVGAGCLLVRRKVIEAMADPWWTLGQIDPSGWGDDLDFCRRIRGAGFTLSCDLDIVVGHKLNGTIWPQRVPEGWVTTLVLGGPQPVAYFPQSSASRIVAPMGSIR